MNYSPIYRQKHFALGQRVGRNKIQPYGIYKISTYDYVDRGRENLRGSEETILFVTGIYDKKVFGLKISNINPVKFFNWFKKVRTKSPIKPEIIKAPGLEGSVIKVNITADTPTAFYELSKPIDMGGDAIYSTYIKNNKDFVAKGAAYRSYKLEGISYATEYKLNPQTTKQYYG